VTKTRYDDYPDHPLYGVPQAVLDAAREVILEALEWSDVSESMVEPMADAVVMRLHEAGFITWPGKGVAHIHAFPPGDPGFTKDGGTLDFGVES
jgi:hypothetical protein